MTSEKLDTKEWLCIGKTIEEKEIRVDYVEGEKNSFTIYCSNNLKIKRPTIFIKS